MTLSWGSYGGPERRAAERIAFLSRVKEIEQSVPGAKDALGALRNSDGNR